jgi:hypothetical protein
MSNNTNDFEERDCPDGGDCKSCPDDLCSWCGEAFAFCELNEHKTCSECFVEQQHEWECEAKAAAWEEWRRYGDDSALVAMGEMPSEYDLDPGVQYNDAGEPIGYM